MAAWGPRPTLQLNGVSERTISYMNVPAARGPLEQSFEELRIDEYLVAYRTTGRPPAVYTPGILASQPFQHLNVPLREDDLVGEAPLDDSPGAVPPSDITLLPREHVSVPEVVLGVNGSEEVLQTLSCQHQFQAFSLEELRCRAYLDPDFRTLFAARRPAAFVFQQTPTTLTPTPPPPAPIQLPHLDPSVKVFTTEADPARPRMPTAYCTLSCGPAFFHHSLEEHRLAWAQACTIGEPRLTAVLNHPPTVPDLTSDDITKLDAAQKASLPSPAPLAGGPFVLSSGIKAW